MPAYGRVSTTGHAWSFSTRLVGMMAQVVEVRTDEKGTNDD